MAFSSRAKTSAPGGSAGIFILTIWILMVCLLLAFMLSNSSSFYVLGGLIGFLTLVACFLSPEFGVAILIMSMLLSPEFGAGAAGSGDSVEAGRSVVVRLDDILLIILSVSWFARTAIHKELGLVLSNPLNRPIGIYVLSCVISTLIGYMAGNVTGKIGIFFVLRYIEYFIVFFIGINILDSPRKMHRFMNIAIFTSIAIALYGIFQIPSGIRVSAPFEGDTGEPNTMGGYLLLLMCMAAGQMVVTKSHRAAIGWGCYIFFLFIPLLFTGSRASWLGVPVAMLALFMFSPRKKEIAMLVIVLGLLGPALLPQTVKERLLFTFKQQEQAGSRVKRIEVGGVRLDTSTSARLASYQTAIKGWKEKPLFGWGITGYIFIDSQFIRTLVETGLVGLGAFLWLTWGYFQAGLAAMRASPDRYQLGLSIGYIAGLFALVAHSSGSNTFIILRVMEPWMVFTAFVIRIPVIQAARDKQFEGTEAEGAGAEKEAKKPEAGEEKTAPKPALKIGSRGQIIKMEPEEGTEDAGEAPAAASRFKKMFSHWETFLRREELELLRRELEEQQRQEAGPKFRRPGGGGAHALAAASGGRRSVMPPDPVPGSSAAGDPPETPRAAPARGVDLARGADLARETPRDAGEK